MSCAPCAQNPGSCCVHQKCPPRCACRQPAVDAFGASAALPAVIIGNSRRQTGAQRSSLRVHRCRVRRRPGHSQANLSGCQSRRSWSLHSSLSGALALNGLVTSPPFDLERACRIAIQDLRCWGALPNIRTRLAEWKWRHRWASQPVMRVTARLRHPCSRPR